MKSMKEFEHIISLGAFCFIVGDLRRLNLRTEAYPFDRNITDIETMISLIDNGFRDFTNINFLQKYDDNQRVFFDNKKYSLLRFVHDYDENLQNAVDVEKKYERRIKRFYNAIKNKTLFVRYIINKSEYKYILKHYKEIEKILRKYNKESRIIFVINDDIKVHQVLNFIKGIKLYPVTKDTQDTVAKCPTDKNLYLKRKLEGCIYAKSKCHNSGL